MPWRDGQACRDPLPGGGAPAGQWTVAGPVKRGRNQHARGKGQRQEKHGEQERWASSATIVDRPAAGRSPCPWCRFMLLLVLKS